ncbi:hypothetical protein WMF21_45180 [Sorangium sp. So ce1099]
MLASRVVTRAISSAKMRSIAARTSDLLAASARSSNGSDMTHCLTGTLGKIRSTSVAASLHIRREAQLRQGPRSLHEKATSTS